MHHSIVIIPALDPPEKLIPYVEKLIQSGFYRILLVNDGSHADKRVIFDQLEQYDAVSVLHHGINLGKGRALKNAFNYVLTKMLPNAENCRGVITADSDGQHTVEDVIKLSDALEQAKEPALILGVRDFSQKDVPIKSSFGNKTTSLFFALLYGKRIADTQTGLRAISKEYISSYMDLFGERFEYETNMLIYAARHEQVIRQIPIQTVYIEQNSGTHFKPIRDSLRIYRILFAGFLKYIFSSGLSAVIDLGLFYLFIRLLGNTEQEVMITAATVAARVISSLCNFMLNRNTVFQSKGKLGGQMLKYYLLCGIQMLTSAGLVVLLHRIFAGSELIEKMIVDAVLFLISYQIQRTFIFKEKREK